jgi:hypothetical protein
VKPTQREAEILVIASCLADYQRNDPSEGRARLIELWRKHHPEAAKEQSVWLHPLMLIHRKEANEPADAPDEVWSNDVYSVNLRRREEDHVFGTWQGMIQLGIAALDGTARHDWREFQAIKNQLAGPETEAFELYPAESRLLDPSNYYTLWCFPGLKRLRVGLDVRRVMDADEALAPQRGLPK